MYKPLLVKCKRLFDCIRSRAKPNLSECAPCVKNASSYAWKEFQPNSKFGKPPMPPSKPVMLPSPTWISGAGRPGTTPSDRFDARGLIGSVVVLNARLRLNPKRTAFTRAELNVCVSSIAKNGRELLSRNWTLLRGSGSSKRVLSNPKFPTRLSWVESL